MVRRYCAGCGDRLRPVRVFRVSLVSPIRATIQDRGIEDRHTTRRWDNRYRPEIITPAGVMRRMARAGERGGRLRGYPWRTYYGPRGRY